MVGSNLMQDMTAAETIGFSKTDLDVRNRTSCINAIKKVSPDIIIHCAAYTSVDGAETHLEEVHAVNAQGTENIAAICEDLKIPMLYLSTDAVFDGLKTEPYELTDQPNPISAYGKSKYEGELIVSRLQKFFILRTNWVYGQGRDNFVTQAIKKLRTEDYVTFPTINQISTPTYVRDLAKVIDDLIQTTDWGTYHFTNSGEASRKEVLSYLAGIFGRSINFSEYKAAAYRPTYIVLTPSFPAPHWMQSLRAFIKDARVALPASLTH